MLLICLLKKGGELLYLVIFLIYPQNKPQGITWVGFTASEHL